MLSSLAKAASPCNFFPEQRLSPSWDWSDPVKESATRWHLKASLSPVVDWGETGHCQQCTCEGLKCLWGELRDSQSVWSEYNGFAEKRKGEGGIWNCNSLVLETLLIQFLDLICICRISWATARKPVLPAVRSWSWVWNWNTQTPNYFFY